MSIRKELSQIRDEKNSPFIVRRFKLFTWLLTVLVPLIMFAIGAGLLASGLMSMMNSAPTLSGNESIEELKQVTINFLNPLSTLLGNFTTYLGLCFYWVIVWLLFRAIAMILNIVRGWSDYKRSVVPVKSIFVTRLIMQGLIVVFLLIAMIGYGLLVQSMMNIMSMYSNEGSSLVNSTIKAIEAANTEQAVNDLINEFQTKLSELSNKVSSTVNQNTINRLASNLICYAVGIALWWIVGIAYGIVIKVKLSHSRELFGKEIEKTTKEKKEKKSKKDKKESEDKEQENTDISDDNQQESTALVNDNEQNTDDSSND